jgi:rod shape-determining protein MreD
MAWVAFSIALLVVYVVQVACHYLLPGWLDLLAALALYYALTAPDADAWLAGWIVGFLQDVGSGTPLGVHAVALGLAARLLTWLRDLVNRELWWVRWLVASIAACGPLLLVELHLRLCLDGSTTVVGMLWNAVATATVAGLVAALASEVPGLLNRRRIVTTRW